MDGSVEILSRLLGEGKKKGPTRWLRGEEKEEERERKGGRGRRQGRFLA